jgi:hypothetical protein
MKITDEELNEKHRREQVERRRRLLEEVERKKRAGGFQNGAEMLQAFRDLFASDEEMEEFGDYLRQMREEERALYRD